MNRYFPQQYNFYPETYIIPDDLKELFKELKKNKNTLIFKPSEASQGSGIILFNKSSDLDNILKTFSSRNSVIQKYIDTPLLLNQ